MKKYGLLATFVCAPVLFACSDNTSSSSPNTENEQAVAPTSKSSADAAKHTDAGIASGVDYHSFANPNEIRVTHLSLDLTANFESKQLVGEVTLDVERTKPENNTLVLDTRALEIERVSVEGESVPFEMGETDPDLGTPLTITLPSAANSVTVAYSTSPEASGVQWLTPAQTAGKKHPFLFTQAQAVHARSFIPLQDSPQVRVTYDATIKTPESLLAVMSASNDPTTERDGEYEFTMPQPIPSYLIALAIGDLEFKAMGERTGVYAEPALLESAAKEFEDTEAMLEVTEETYGPYQWDRYDLLILPPSFPFGGMENPRLSFITPTVIAGDKSLVSLIAHELAHSWSGNTVTNATWRDLWLNEGFTTYLTYRIMEMIYGHDRFKKEAVLGYQDLENDVAALEENDEILAIDLRGRNPDDVFSNIPYEKGALFLREIEQKIGRENFDAFLMQYFKDFAFKSITTDTFIAYLDDTLLKQYPDKLDANRIHTWIFEPGIPEGAPHPESDAFTKIDDTRSAWLSGDVKAADIETAQWTVHEWLYFLNNMPESLSEAQLAELDSAFSLTSTKNNEIAHSWLMIAVQNNYQPAYDRLYSYLVSIGRNKLVKPLYRELSKTPEGKAFAKRAFEEAKPGYHPLTVKANEGFVN
ncbi:putative cold-active aminopeptidase [Alteromonas macleodii str. 'Black Sea 11']|nr:putative cold-active aminopeptidase [Alteromonas macleodii str. 'Black Sea 11']NKW88369.1 M1 family metallopeptidase [Alteromonadaceae bacterium A_SAG4]NKX03707.1 M1 family metallopeptidase [Alteromonadaceae bacterium A_SAG6]NKX34253.1 M1 family metallopeptidase [Alteromonadaceae bacterium A_SAG3]NKX70009.1 M1 family metallopeptidase [Alteromonadaceae bacterium A_SAG7]